MPEIRRSPRTLSSFLNNQELPYFNPEQSVLLYALSHCTGWSAERISHKFRDLSNFHLTPDLIWTHYNNWISSRITGGDMLPAEIELMKVVLCNNGLQWQGVGRPLSMTLRPVYVEFQRCWSPKDGTPLFEGFTTVFRQAGKDILLQQNNFAVVGKLNPLEEQLVARFGHWVTVLIKDTLRCWARELKSKLSKEPLLSTLNTRHHGYVSLIIEYLNYFQASYEEIYGKIDEQNRPRSSSPTRLYITNTGYGIKLFLGLLMADRLQVIDAKRKLQAAEVAFLELALSDVPEDSRDCPVCQDQMGVTNPEGELEMPLKMVVCCNQVIGKECLRRWLAEQDTCPCCRHVMSDSFQDKLFESDDDDEEARDEIALQEQLVDAAGVGDTIVVDVPRGLGQMFASQASQSFRSEDLMVSSAENASSQYSEMSGHHILDNYRLEDVPGQQGEMFSNRVSDDNNPAADHSGVENEHTFGDGTSDNFVMEG